MPSTMYHNKRQGASTIPLVYRIVTVLCFSIFVFNAKLFAKEPPEIVTFFLNLINENKDAYKAESFNMTEENGVTTLRFKDSTSDKGQFTFDKKNLYLQYNNAAMEGLLGKNTKEVGLYFKTDKTPIAAVSTNVKSEHSLGFYEYSCPAAQAPNCASKDVTKEIFPVLNIKYFFKKDWPWIESGQPSIIFRIPRVGTTINAYICVPFIEGKGEEIVSLVKYSNCKINWNKKKGSFEIGKCNKEPYIPEEC